MKPIIFAMALQIALPAEAAEISGNASEVRVIGGDTIDIAGERIHLHGIDALETNQMCDHGDGCFKCAHTGVGAFTVWFMIQPNASVFCDYQKRDRHKRIIGTCFIDGQNINALLVRAGWAVADRRYSKDYVEEEEAARKAKRGMWEGKFVTPEKWRKGERLACEQ